MHSNQHHPAVARRGRRLFAMAATTVAIAASAVLVTAGPAAAHVHADGDAVVGERADVTFRVPTESETASTTSVTITLPLDMPITSVRAQSKSGWEVEITRVDLDEPVVVGDVSVASAIGSVTWTATGPGVAPGEFDEFIVQLGPIPDAEQLVLPTTQGYSDGTVVEWSEVSDGTTEPERPAPVLLISAAAEDGGDGHGHGSDATEAPGDDHAEETPASNDSGLELTGIALGAFGLVVAVVAVIIAVVAVRRARRA